MFIWLLVCAVLFIVMACSLKFLRKRIKPPEKEFQMRIDRHPTYFDSRCAACEAFKEERKYQ